MTDGDALRRAVVADPDDDTPRLIYADWLDETGDPDRAAFVRAQVEAARAEAYSPAARAAAALADDLLDRHAEDWGRHLYRRALDWKFTRGFVEHVTVDAATFPGHAGYLFENEPIRSVRVHRSLPARGGFRSDGADDAVSLRPVFQKPELWQITRLDLSGVGLSEDEFDALETSRVLVGVRDLSFRNSPINDTARVAGLLAGRTMRHLCGLDVAECSHLGPAVVEGLRKASHRRIARLDLSGVRIALWEDMKRLLGSACLKQVEELRLARPVAWSGAGPLVHLNLGWVLPWERLRVLDLTGQRVGPQGVHEIATTPESRHLRWLGLGHNGISTGMDELIGAKHLNLYYLDVRGNGLDADTFAALRKRFPGAVIPEEGGIRGFR